MGDGGGCSLSNVAITVMDGNDEAKTTSSLFTRRAVYRVDRVDVTTPFLQLTSSLLTMYHYPCT